MIVNPVEERLFDTYAYPLLEELRHFPDGEVIDFLNALPLEERQRVALFDRARHLYFQWSADAFSIGLHLGLSLAWNDDVRRPRPEQG